jgi:FkbM family methyltransferase
MELDFTEKSAYRYFACGETEREVVRLLSALVGTGATVFDVGANLGFFALLASRVVGPTGHVVAFEPDPSNVERIRRNLRHNPGRTVDVEALAVADEAGEARFHIGHQDEVGSLLRDPQHVTDRSVAVPTVSLDRYLDEHAIERVDFLKMDIEGAEVLALRGMQRGLEAGRYRHLVLEWHGDKRDELSAQRGRGMEPVFQAGYCVRRLTKHLRPGRPALEPFHPSDLERRVHLLCQPPGCA